MLVRQLKPALLVLLLLTLVTGVAYPLAVTGIAQILFPAQANGSLLMRGGAVVGSALVGQAFDGPGYFWGRPSATSKSAYDGAASSGSNLGPLNDDLVAAVRRRVAALRAADPGNTAPVPIDLVTASASGLDPHISPAAAAYQVERVARQRGLSVDVIRTLVARYTAGRQLGVLGEPRVDVLQLNLALDDLEAARPARPALH